MIDNSFSADSNLLNALAKRAQHLSCSEKQVLFQQGDSPDGLFILEQGEAVLVMKSDAGQTVMCVEAGAGSLLGLPGLIAKEPYTLTAILRGGSAASFISRDDFERTLLEEPGLYSSVLQILAAQCRTIRRAFAESHALIGVAL